MPNLNFEKMQKAKSVIKDSARSILHLFEYSTIVSIKELERSLQEAKNIVGWMEYLIRI